MKVVHRQRSDKHSNQSDPYIIYMYGNGQSTASSIRSLIVLLLVLLVVVVLLLVSKCLAPFPHLEHTQTHSVSLCDAFMSFFIFIFILF